MPLGNRYGNFRGLLRSGKLRLWEFSLSGLLVLTVSGCQDLSQFTEPSGDPVTGNSPTSGQYFQLAAGANAPLFLNENLAAANLTSAVYQKNNIEGLGVVYTPLAAQWDSDAKDGAGAFVYPELSGEAADIQNGIGFANWPNPQFGQSEATWQDAGNQSRISARLFFQSFGDAVEVCRSVEGFCLTATLAGDSDSPRLDLSLTARVLIPEGTDLGNLSDSGVYGNITGTDEGLAITVAEVTESLDNAVSPGEFFTLTWQSSQRTPEEDEPTGDLSFSVSVNGETVANFNEVGLYYFFANALGGSATEQLRVEFASPLNSFLTSDVSNGRIPLNLRIGAEPDASGYEVFGDENNSLCQAASLGEDNNTCLVQGPFQNARHTDDFVGSSALDSGTLAYNLSNYYENNGLHAGSEDTVAGGTAIQLIGGALSALYFGYWQQVFGPQAAASNYSLRLFNGAAATTSDSEADIAASNQNLRPGFSEIRVEVGSDL